MKKMNKNFIKVIFAVWVVLVASVYFYYKDDAMSVILQNDEIKVVVDAEKCGRIMYLGTPEKNYLVVNDVDSTAEGWINFGGSYLWIAPQHNWPGGWPPPVELDGTPWQLVNKTKNSAVVRSQSYKGIILERKISIDGSEVAVENVMYNTSDAAQEWGLWSISQIPMESKIECGMAVDNIKVFSYPPSANVEELKDAGVLNISSSLEGSDRSSMGVTFNTIPTDNNGNVFRYKLGCISDSDLLKITTPLGVFYKSVSYNGSDASVYPHECNVEVYTEGHYVEVEALGNKVLLKPKESNVLKTTFIIGDKKMR